MSSAVRKVVLIDSGGANIASLQFALSRLGCQGVLSADAGFIRAAGHVILPGVGAAAAAMSRLREAGLDTLITSLSQPVLGICLGMQLMFDRSEESDTDCLGIMKGEAHLIPATPGRPVPHMGWNQVHAANDSPMLSGITSGAYFYFVHSYAIGKVPSMTATVNYEQPFTAIAEQDNFVATQFHPEKSGPAGAQLLKNFLART